MTFEIRPGGSSLCSSKLEPPQSLYDLLDIQTSNRSGGIVISDKPLPAYVSLHNPAVNIIKAFNHKNDDILLRVAPHAHHLPNLGSSLTPQLNICIAANHQLIFASKRRDCHIMAAIHHNPRPLLQEGLNIVLVRSNGFSRLTAKAGTTNQVLTSAFPGEARVEANRVVN